MSIIILLILVSLALGVSFLAAFVWAVKSGQFEDTTTPSLRILPEDATTSVQPVPSHPSSNNPSQHPLQSI